MNEPMALGDLDPIEEGPATMAHWRGITAQARLWAFEYACSMVDGRELERKHIPSTYGHLIRALHLDAKPDPNYPLYKERLTAEYTVLGEWWKVAYDILMDTGPVQESIRNMQASKAAYMFRKKLGKVQYLAEPCKPILTHILPKFRGIEAPSCKLVWKPADYVVDVVVVDPPVATP